MKKVTITIEGTIQICEYASTCKEFYDTFYMTLGWPCLIFINDGNTEIGNNANIYAGRANNLVGSNCWFNG